MFLQSEYDFIQAISGADIDGNGRCVVSIQPQRQNAEGKITDTDDAFETEKPVVEMCKQAGGWVMVDFIFNSVDDMDLHKMYSYLQCFFRASNSVSDDELDFPLLVFTFVPLEGEGEFFAVGINPIFYALTPEDSKGEPTIIRTVFKCQDEGDAVPNFLFLRADEEMLENIKNEDDEDYEDSVDTESY